MRAICQIYWDCNIAGSWTVPVDGPIDESGQRSWPARMIVYFQLRIVYYNKEKSLRYSLVELVHLDLWILDLQDYVRVPVAYRYTCTYRYTSYKVCIRVLHSAERSIPKIQYSVQYVQRL